MGTLVVGVRVTPGGNVGCMVGEVVGIAVVGENVGWSVTTGELVAPPSRVGEAEGKAVGATEGATVGCRVHTGLSNAQVTPAPKQAGMAMHGPVPVFNAGFLVMLMLVNPKLIMPVMEATGKEAAFNPLLIRRIRKMVFLSTVQPTVWSGVALQSHGFALFVLQRTQAEGAPVLV